MDERLPAPPFLSMAPLVIVLSAADRNCRILAVKHASSGVCLLPPRQITDAAHGCIMRCELPRWLRLKMAVFTKARVETMAYAGSRIGHGFVKIFSGLCSYVWRTKLTGF